VALQRDYQSLNYAHAAESLFELGIHVLIQLIARNSRSGKARYSLSCNPDLTLDVVVLYRRRSKPIFVVGGIYPDLWERKNSSAGGHAKIDNSAVYENAKFFDNARIEFHSQIYGDAEVSGNTKIDNAEVFGNARIFGDAKVSGRSTVARTNL
jgi:hypothetical protein